MAHLKDAAVASGYSCPNWQLSDGPKYAKEVGTCSDEDVFSIYATDADLQAQRELSEGVINMLIGPNWIINIPETYRHQVQLGLGGEHVPGSMEEPSEDPTEKATTAPSKPTITRAQAEALESAESYLESGHFSKKGLFDQLTSEYGENFSKKDATYALNHVNADYNAEAREAAESYLESGHFSRNSLMDQLTSEYGEQFTKAQAAQAVKSVGL